MKRCGCEDGGDCTKTTVCAVESAVEYVQEELLPVVEAACAFVDLQREAHHVPVKNERKIKVRAELYNAVMNYQENQQ